MFDPAANKLLSDNGWLKGADGVRARGGQRLEFEYSTPLYPAFQSWRIDGEAIIQRNLRDVGIKLDINAVPSDDFFDKYVTPGNYDITPFAWLGTPFPISSAQSIYANPHGDQIQQNYARVGSAKIDDLMTQAAASLDQNQAFNLINQADALIWQEVHSIVFYQRPQMTAVRKNLANVGSYGFAQPDYSKIGFVGNPS